MPNNYENKKHTHSVMTEILKTNSKKILNKTVILLYINRNAVINGQKHKN